MRATAFLFFGILLFLGSTSTRSQQIACPPGSVPIGGGNAGWVSCSPAPDQGGAEPATAGPQWATRWGAIATAGGAFGTANNMSSKRKAANAAMAQCKANGGKDCEIALTYWNQCAALVWGDTTAISRGDADPRKAESGAMQACSAVAGNNDCKLYYSACSYPEQVR
jgi:hypothetical protein